MIHFAPLVPNKKIRGFTLIEVLLYSVLTVIVISFSIFTIYAFLDSRDRDRQQRELVENQKLLEQKIYWALQSVSAINTPSAGASAASLSVNKLNFSDNPAVIDASGQIVRLKRGAASPVNITDRRFAEVQNLTFEQVDLAGEPAIRVTATLINNFTSTTVAIDTTIATK